MRRNRLSNMNLRNFRNDMTYQAVITDLYLAGVIDKAKAENILGYKIPDELKKPEWYKDDESTNESDDSE